MQEEKASTLTFTTRYGDVVSVSTTDGCDVFDDFIDNLVRPVCRAAGWAEGTINDVLGEYC